jgi:uncharacterized protein (DUF4415 family)
MPKTIETHSGRILKLNTAEEEAAIQEGIAQDTDTREWTQPDFAAAKPAREILPEKLFLALTGKRGRPKSAAPKVFTGIRFDADVLEGLKATGHGWRTRVNDAMREWLKTHPA